LHEQIAIGVALIIRFVAERVLFGDEAGKLFGGSV